VHGIRLEHEMSEIPGDLRSTRERASNAKTRLFQRRAVAGRNSFADHRHVAARALDATCRRRTSSLLNLWVRVAPVRRKSIRSCWGGSLQGIRSRRRGNSNSDVPPPSVRTVDLRPRFFSRRGGASGLRPG
jgi:hypothetical protein